eukprot:g9943.t1
MSLHIGPSPSPRAGFPASASSNETPYVHWAGIQADATNRPKQDLSYADLRALLERIEAEQGSSGSARKTVAGANNHGNKIVAELPLSCRDVVLPDAPHDFMLRVSKQPALSRATAAQLESATYMGLRFRHPNTAYCLWDSDGLGTSRFQVIGLNLLHIVAEKEEKGPKIVLKTMRWRRFLELSQFLRDFAGKQNDEQEAADEAEGLGNAASEHSPKDKAEASSASAKKGSVSLQKKQAAEEARKKEAKAAADEMEDANVLIADYEEFGRLCGGDQLKDLADWLCDADFGGAGVIVFDDAHRVRKCDLNQETAGDESDNEQADENDGAAGPAQQGDGRKQGKSNAAAKGKAQKSLKRKRNGDIEEDDLLDDGQAANGIETDELVRQHANVIYSTASPGTKLHDFEYLERLDLWGPMRVGLQCWAEEGLDRARALEEARDWAAEASPANIEDQAAPPAAAADRTQIYPLASPKELQKEVLQAFSDGGSSQMVGAELLTTHLRAMGALSNYQPRKDQEDTVTVTVEQFDAHKLALMRDATKLLLLLKKEMKDFFEDDALKEAHRAEAKRAAEETDERKKQGTRNKKAARGGKNKEATEAGDEDPDHAADAGEEPADDEGAAVVEEQEAVDAPMPKNPEKKELTAYKAKKWMEYWRLVADVQSEILTQLKISACIAQAESARAEGKQVVIITTPKIVCTGENSEWLLWRQIKNDMSEAGDEGRPVKQLMDCVLELRSEQMGGAGGGGAAGGEKAVVGAAASGSAAAASTGTKKQAVKVKQEPDAGKAAQGGPVASSASSRKAVRVKQELNESGYPGHVESSKSNAAAEPEDAAGSEKYSCETANLPRREVLPAILEERICNSIGSLLLVDAVPVEDDGGARSRQKKFKVSAPHAKRRQKLLEMARRIHWPGKPVDVLLDHFGGPERVAEITGRYARWVRKSYDQTSDAANYSLWKWDCRNGNEGVGSRRHVKEAHAFRTGRKTIALCSEDASKGINLAQGGTDHAVVTLARGERRKAKAAQLKREADDEDVDAGDAEAAASGILDDANAITVAVANENGIEGDTCGDEHAADGALTVANEVVLGLGNAAAQSSKTGAGGTTRAPRDASPSTGRLFDDAPLAEASEKRVVIFLELPSSEAALESVRGVAFGTTEKNQNAASAAGDCEFMLLTTDYPCETAKSSTLAGRLRRGNAMLKGSGEVGIDDLVAADVNDNVGKRALELMLLRELSSEHTPGWLRALQHWNTGNPSMEERSRTENTVPAYVLDFWYDAELFPDRVRPGASSAGPSSPPPLSVSDWNDWRISCRRHLAQMQEVGDEDAWKESVDVKRFYSRLFLLTKKKQKELSRFFLCIRQAVQQEQDEENRVREIFSGGGGEDGQPALKVDPSKTEVLYEHPHGGKTVLDTVKRDVGISWDTIFRKHYKQLKDERAKKAAEYENFKSRPDEEKDGLLLAGFGAGGSSSSAAGGGTGKGRNKSKKAAEGGDGGDASKLSTKGDEKKTSNPYEAMKFLFEVDGFYRYTEVEGFEQVVFVRYDGKSKKFFLFAPNLGRVRSFPHLGLKKKAKKQLVPKKPAGKKKAAAKKKGRKEVDGVLPADIDGDLGLDLGGGDANGIEQDGSEIEAAGAGETKNIAPQQGAATGAAAASSSSSAAGGGQAGEQGAESADVPPDSEVRLAAIMTAAIKEFSITAKSLKEQFTRFEDDADPELLKRLWNRVYHASETHGLQQMVYDHTKQKRLSQKGERAKQKALDEIEETKDLHFTEISSGARRQTIYFLSGTYLELAAISRDLLTYGSAKTSRVARDVCVPGLGYPIALLPDKVNRVRDVCALLNAPAGEAFLQQFVAKSGAEGAEVQPPQELQAMIPSKDINTNSPAAEQEALRLWVPVSPKWRHSFADMLVLREIADMFTFSITFDDEDAAAMGEFPPPLENGDVEMADAAEYGSENVDGDANIAGQAAAAEPIGEAGAAADSKGTRIEQSWFNRREEVLDLALSFLDLQEERGKPGWKSREGLFVARAAFRRLTQRGEFLYRRAVWEPVAGAGKAPPHEAAGGDGERKAEEMKIKCLPGWYLREACVHYRVHDPQLYYSAVEEVVEMRTKEGKPLGRGPMATKLEKKLRRAARGGLGLDFGLGDGLADDHIDSEAEFFSDHGAENDEGGAGQGPPKKKAKEEPMKKASAKARGKKKAAAAEAQEEGKSTKAPICDE